MKIGKEKKKKKEKVKSGYHHVFQNLQSKTSKQTHRRYEKEFEKTDHEIHLL